MIDRSARIHSSSFVEDGATLGADVEIGPFCHVGPEVSLAAGVQLKSHAVVTGRTKIGERTEIYPFASIGHAPQDLKYDGEPSELIIGARNRIRESVTMNPGTAGGGMVTRVGDDNLFMVNVHVGHDALIGDGCVFANNVSLAGHVVVEDQVVIGGHSGIHQFVRIGKGAMIGVLSAVVADVIPYGTVTGETGHIAGLNFTGLKRRGAEKAVMQELRVAYRQIFAGGGTLKERAAAVAGAHPENPLITEIATFILSESDRAFVLPKD